MNPYLADRVAGEQRCLFGTAEHHCAANAVLHIMQTDENPAMVCAEHAPWWANRPIHDLHPISACCGIPGTTWMYGTATTPGHCAVEDLDDGDLMSELVRISQGPHPTPEEQK